MPPPTQPRRAAVTELPPSRRKRLTVTRRGWVLAYALLLPSLVILAVVVLYPVVSSVVMSFTDRTLLNPQSGASVGLGNYNSLFTDPNFYQALGNTAVWTVFNVVLQVCLGTGLAVLLNTKLAGRGILRSAAIIPWVVPSVAAALIWRYLYDPSLGLFNSILRGLGLIDKNVIWLGDTSTALGSVIVESIWKGTPFVMIIILAGLQAIPHERYEAAATDGAGAWRTFWNIVVPALRPTLALATILTTVYTVNNFNAIWLMTEGGPLGATEILFTLGYRIAFVKYDFGLAAAVSVVLFVVLLVIATLYLFVLERKDDSE